MQILSVKFLLVIALIFKLTGFTDLSGQILINEFQASNTLTLQDPDYQDYSDWIELYNENVTAMDLSGYFLTDNLLNPVKWKIPAGALIPGSGYLIIWADGRNSGLHTGFNLSSESEEIGLFSPMEELVDSVTYNQQYANISFGRVGGAAGWAYFTEPTPGESNDGDSYPGISPEVHFSLEGGFYNSALSITLSSDEPAADIRYTTDGSEPKAASMLFSGTLSVPVTTIVRARSFENTRLPGKITGHSYFINEQKHDLPVISVFTDPANLWDSQSGIYVNYEEDWERPCGIEYFAPQGDQVFSMNAGLQIFGGASRGAAQKSFAVFSRSEYGDGPIEYSLLPGRETAVYNSFILRNSANDWYRSWRGTMFRDALMHNIVENQMDLDYQSYQPASIYLNGEYWGILNIRDKHNEDYCEIHYGIDHDSVDIIKNNDVISGNNTLYNEMINFLENHDLSVQENYESAASMIDIDEYINYMITEIYCCNIDWPANNHRLWRSEQDGGRWRWMLYDLDFGFNGFQWGPPSSNLFTIALNPDIDDYVRTGLKAPWATIVFRKLTQNELFRKKFISAFITQVYTTYDPDRVVHIVDSLSANLVTEMPRHIARWAASGSIFNMQEWQQNIDGMRDFATERPYYALKQLQETFGLQSGSKVNVEIISEEGGKISLNKTPVSVSDFNAQYFTGLPLELVLTPASGYKFTEWVIEDPAEQEGQPLITRDNPLEITLEGDIRITARLEREDEIPLLKINEIMAGNSTGIVDEKGNHDDWIEIYNAGTKSVDLGGLFMTDTLGKPAKWKIPSTAPGTTTVDPGGFILLWADDEPDEGVLHLGFKLDKSGEQVGLFKQIGEEMAVIDTLSFPALATDVSLARYPDGTGPWIVFDEATPGSGNFYVGEENFFANAMNPVIYPNPTTGYIRIGGIGNHELNYDDIIELTVLNASGRIIKYHKFTSVGEVEMDLSGQASGLYLVKIKIGKQYFSRRVILVQ